MNETSILGILLVWSWLPWTNLECVHFKAAKYLQQYNSITKKIIIKFCAITVLKMPCSLYIARFQELFRSNDDSWNKSQPILQNNSMEVHDIFSPTSLGNIRYHSLVSDNQSLSTGVGVPVRPLPMMHWTSPYRDSLPSQICSNLFNLNYTVWGPPHHPIQGTTPCNPGHSPLPSYWNTFLSTLYL